MNLDLQMASIQHRRLGIAIVRNNSKTKRTRRWMLRMRNLDLPMALLQERQCFEFQTWTLNGLVQEDGCSECRIWTSNWPCSRIASDPQSHAAIIKKITESGCHHSKTVVSVLKTMFLLFVLLFCFVRPLSFLCFTHGRTT